MIRRMLFQKGQVFLWVILCMSLCVVGCGQSDDENKKQEEQYYRIAAAYEVANAAMGSVDNFANGSYDVFATGEKENVELILGVYGLTEMAVQITDLHCYVSSTNSADEIAAFVVKKEARAAVQEALQRRIESRKALFEGYEPEEVKKLSKSEVVTFGSVVVLLVCDDVSAAKDAIEECLTGDGQNSLTPTPQEVTKTPEISREPERTPTPTTSVESDVYGEGCANGYTPELVEALKTGNKGLLSSKYDLELFEVCSTLMKENISEDMSLYEKERAVYAMIIGTTDYDKGHYSVLGEDKNSVNPYGTLVNQKAICTGYATTFALFMEVLEIPCVIVTGSANYDHEPHAWNMVQLDGEWYYVDVCWGEAGAGRINYGYLNVSTKYMQNTEHHWDVDAYPYVKNSYNDKK